MAEVLEELERGEVSEVLISPGGADLLGSARSHRPASTPPSIEHDERAARADLRRQIAAMEAELGAAVRLRLPPHRDRVPRRRRRAAAPGSSRWTSSRSSATPSPPASPTSAAGSTTHAYVEEQNRELIEQMTADPSEYKWVRVSNEDIGEPGCRHWHSRPRWGILGMLMGWWRVKVSSGCPLAAPA